MTNLWQTGKYLCCWVSLRRFRRFSKVYLMSQGNTSPWFRDKVTSQHFQALRAIDPLWIFQVMLFFKEMTTTTMMNQWSDWWCSVTSWLRGDWAEGGDRLFREVFWGSCLTSELVNNNSRTHLVRTSPREGLGTACWAQAGPLGL